MGPDTDTSEEKSVDAMAGLSASWGETREGRTRLERLIEVARTLYEPTLVSDVAEAADCSTNFAADKLELLSELGILEVASDNPTTYRRDEVHFRRLRARNLVAEHDGDIESAIETYRERDDAFRERFGVDSPAAVTWERLDAIDGAEAVADAKDALSTWAVVRRRLVDLQRARAIATTEEQSMRPSSHLAELEDASETPFGTGF